ncbi:MAG: glucose-6-phosphate dehydrogenase, partial [Xanthomonadales bacterium]|nr:glucose-6-phosphate dehydrogenase [Xanthomonadales bacterium]
MAQFNPVDEFDLIIFGGAGDLALRKLMPALFHRDGDGQLPPKSRIISVGRRPLGREGFLEQVESSLRKRLSAEEFTDERWKSFARRLEYFSADARDSSSWSDLVDALKGQEHRTRVVYLATVPDLYGSIATGFHDHGLLHEDVRIVLEKPVGRDYDSARAINDEVGACFPEHRIFRIDHYLGKESVQNIMVMRFANSIFEPLWNHKYIDHVQITAAEEVGVGTRGGYYDKTGALRDM